MGFFRNLSNYYRRQKILFKQHIKLHFIYPSRYPHSRLESILPRPVERIMGDHLQVACRVGISEDLVSLGRYVYIGWDTHITACRSIGSFCSISHNVKIGLGNHALDHVGTSPVFYSQRKGWVSRDTFSEDAEGLCEIGHDVLISAGVIIIRGIKIGHGAVIGAGTVVTKDVPPYAIVAGSPAKVIRYRFDETTISRLLKSEWWSWPEERLKKESGSFNNVGLFLDRTGS